MTAPTTTGILVPAGMTTNIYLHQLCFLLAATGEFFAKSPSLRVYMV